MTLFIDASVIVSILQRQDGAEDLYARLVYDGGPYGVSPIVRIEATLAMARAIEETDKGRTRQADEILRTARAAVDAFIEAMGAREVLITDRVASHALDAAAMFGKSLGRNDGFNMGDCLAHACAREFRGSLAYKGDTFDNTDMEWIDYRKTDEEIRALQRR